MSLVYRAIWSQETRQDHDGLVASARRCLSRWAMDDPGAEVLDDGERAVRIVGQSPRERAVRLRTVVTEATQGFEAVVVDVPDAGTGAHTVWTTTMRVAVSAEGVHTWIDNSVESDDATLRVKVGRPRVVDDLLALPGTHRLGGSAVLRSALTVSAGEVPVLVEVLRDAARTLPYIVFSQAPGADDGAWLRKAEQTATRSAGVAVVVTLDVEAAAAFREHLGDLAVWNGAARTYVPAPLDSRGDGYQHRYLLPDRLAQHSAVDRLVYAVTQASTRRRVPQVFSTFLEPAAVATDLVSGSPADEEAELELLLVQEDLDGVTRELSEVRGHLERLRASLSEQALDELFWTARDPGDQPESLPDEVQDTSDAIQTAQQHLTDWLVVPDGAVRELDGIDTAPNAYSWGNTTWRGLRALALYAQSRQEGYQGNFWSWCQSGNPLGWPATSKKLSMTESETLQSNAKFMNARSFPASVELDPSGRMHMLSHLKIAEGGGDLAPRVYFHDDTGGTTRKVHIGFIGPHHLVPNTKS